MRAQVWTLLLGVGVALALLALAPGVRQIRLPGDHQGFEPEQPIAYSHRLHAGELGIDCQYCHSGASRSRYAGIPSAGVCMNCHRFIKAPRTQIRAEELAAESEGREPVQVTSAEIAKLYESLGLDENLEANGQGVQQGVSPIRWRRVHQLPDFVYFDHRPHVAHGLACQKCHGAVETMERVRQVETLSMGWCVDCHRDPLGGNGDAAHPVASTDCAVCHY